MTSTVNGPPQNQSIYTMMQATQKREFVPLGLAVSYLKQFGAERGAEYLSRGLSWQDANRQFMQDGRTR